MEQADKGRFPGGHIFYSVCFFFLLSVFMLNYFILVISIYKNDKQFHFLTLYIELCTKYVGVG